MLWASRCCVHLSPLNLQSSLWVDMDGTDDVGVAVGKEVRVRGSSNADSAAPGRKYPEFWVIGPQL